MADKAAKTAAALFKCAETPQKILDCAATANMCCDISTVTKVGETTDAITVLRTASAMLGFPSVMGEKGSFCKLESTAKTGAWKNAATMVDYTSECVKVAASKAIILGALSAIAASVMVNQF